MRPNGSDMSARRAAYVVLAVAIGARLAMAALIPLAPDESYYWEWSRRLASGYLDHPSAVALLVRLGTAMLGVTPLGVRIGSVLAGALASLVIVRIASSMGGERAMPRAAWIIACMPLAQVGLALATPDAPLLLFWALALAALIPAVRRESTVAWALAGGALGAALSSKYTAFLLLLGVGVAIAAQPSLRAQLATPGPWLGLAAALVVFVPNLLWNAHHDWASFAYQLAHGLSVHRGSALSHEALLLGGQIGLVSPLLLVLLAVAVWRALRRRDDPARTLLAIIASVTWLMFVASALRSAVEPNWQAPAYLSAIVLAASCDGGERWRKLFRASVAIGGAITLLIYAQALVAFLPLSAAADPTASGTGWGSLAAHVDSARAGAPAGAASWVGGERYQEASELAFHLADHPVTFVIDVRGRPNQYDLWPAFPERAHAGDRLVLVLGLFTTADSDPVIAALAPHFASVTLHEVVALRRGGNVRAWRRVWVLEGWRGSWPAAQLAR
jgi:4-amino-4-deoxy-L-arabinose transferase-like glycosyltransferase